MIDTMCYNNLLDFIEVIEFDVYILTFFRIYTTKLYLSGQSLCFQTR